MSLDLDLKVHWGLRGYFVVEKEETSSGSDSGSEWTREKKVVRGGDVTVTVTKVWHVPTGDGHGSLPLIQVGRCVGEDPGGLVVVTGPSRHRVRHSYQRRSTGRGGNERRTR